MAASLCRHFAQRGALSRAPLLLSARPLSSSFGSSSSSSKGRRFIAVSSAVAGAGIVGGFFYLHTLPVSPDDSLSHNTLVTVLRALPLRLTSRLFGAVMSTELPLSMRSPVYKAWMSFFNGNLDEVERPLDEYPSMSLFFTRHLKSGARSWPASSGPSTALSSPADGRVMQVGRVRGPLVEQIKGSNYSLDGFLGDDFVYETLADGSPSVRPRVATAKNSQNDLFYCVIYLGPGDYHRFHSPATWTVNVRRHYAGELLSVSPLMVRAARGLFNFNERVVLAGQWERGYMAFAAIGATNVGSIKIGFDDAIDTNRVTDRAGDPVRTRVFGKGGVPLKRGDEVGMFQMGSCIVVVFENRKEFKFNVGEGEVVRVGQTIGQ